jgi:hypothetical protein
MADWPDFESVQAQTLWLRSHVSSEEYPMFESQWNLGGVAGWPCGWSPGRPSPPTDLIKLMEAPLYPYIRIPMVEFTHTTLFL